MKKIYLSALAFALIVGAGITTTKAFAENGNEGGTRGEFKMGTNMKMGHRPKGDHKPGVFGTVTAVSGSTITLTSKGFGPNATAVTTYTVDATNAKIEKERTTGSIASILVGDMIMVEGTVTGTTVTATIIHDGKPGKEGNKDEKSPFLEGNGQPIIGGTVTTLNGNIITITNKSNLTYTIDVTTAKIIKGDKSGIVSDISIGDSILAQGTINGTTVTAVTFVDQGQMKVHPSQEEHKGFFRGIGAFFSHLFGF